MTFSPEQIQRLLQVRAEIEASPHQPDATRTRCTTHDAPWADCLLPGLPGLPDVPVPPRPGDREYGPAARHRKPR